MDSYSVVVVCRLLIRIHVACYYVARHLPHSSSTPSPSCGQTDLLTWCCWANDGWSFSFYELSGKCSISFIGHSPDQRRPNRRRKLMHFSLVGRSLPPPPSPLLSPIIDGWKWWCALLRDSGDLCWTWNWQTARYNNSKLHSLVDMVNGLHPPFSSPPPHLEAIYLSIAISRRASLSAAATAIRSTIEINGRASSSSSTEMDGRKGAIWSIEERRRWL